MSAKAKPKKGKKLNIEKRYELKKDWDGITDWEWENIINMPGRTGIRKVTREELEKMQELAQKIPTLNEEMD
tara:strand:+ start:69 stop:284 length:216 start_codon:yes stop_codon:yes gene_type:complete